MSKPRLAAAVLAVCSAFSLVIAAHHPRTVHDALVDQITHATLIGAIIAIECILISYALRPSANRSVSLIAIVLSALGTIGIVFAGCTDGFFVPWFQSYVASGTVDSHSGLSISRAAWIVIELLSKLGFIAFGGAGVLWCGEMALHAHFRTIGFIGALAALSLVGFAVVGGPLGPHNVLVAAALLAAWCCAIAYRYAQLAHEQ